MATYPHIVGEQERPASLHAEMTILGAMLVEPVAINDATMLLKTDDFALDSHRRIYSVMVHLSEVGHAVDIVTVGEELRKRKELDSIGGLPYLASLSEGLPRKLSIESYVRIVRDKSLMRQLMAVCDLGMIDAADRRIEVLEQLIRNARGNFRSVAPGEGVFVGHNHATGFFHRIGNCVPVVRRKASQIDHFDGLVGKSLLKLHRRLKRLLH